MDAVAIVVLSIALTAVAAVLGRSLLRMRRTMRRLDLLGRIADVSDHGGGMPETLDEICSVLVPELADFCMVDLVGQGGGVDRVAVRVGAGGGEDAARGLAEREPSFPYVGAERREDRTPGARFYGRLSESDLVELSHDPEDLEFLRGLGIESAITVPLKARGRLTGALTLGVAWSGRRYSTEHAEFARILSGRVALTLENAGLFADLEAAEEERAEIAETLQHGLLPPPLPEIPGWSVAAAYRPAGAQNEVGGDFYDAFPAAGGWMLVIGDVTGRGARAASVTAQARYTLRTAAALTGDPLLALSTLNRALLARSGLALCSVVAIAVAEDPARPLRIAVAGHPPPLLVDGESVVELAAAGPVLGAFAEAEWSLEQAVVDSGQVLVVVTDGIAEAGTRRGRFGEERTRAALAGSRGSVQAVARLEESLRSFAGEELEDDVAILALARAAPDPEGHALALGPAETAQMAGELASGAAGG